MKSSNTNQRHCDVGLRGGHVNSASIEKSIDSAMPNGVSVACADNVDAGKPRDEHAFAAQHCIALAAEVLSSAFTG
jgi:hypothetical protein